MGLLSALNGSPLTCTDTYRTPTDAACVRRHGERGVGLHAAQPPGGHAFVKTTESKAAAAARIGAALGRRKRAELLELLRPCCARVEPWLQAGKYAAALVSDLPGRNGWTLAGRAGTGRRTGCSGCSAGRPGMPPR
jgi:hypothetical protein